MAVEVLYYKRVNLCSQISPIVLGAADTTLRQYRRGKLPFGSTPVKGGGEEALAIG